MDVLTAIRERRSIRRFTGDPVSDQQLNTILHAGLCAPTARNLRPFHFVLIQDGDLLHKLAQGKVHARMLSSAAAGIAICGDKTVEDRMEHLYADCYAATQNILLAIHGLGLGGVWLGVTRDSDWYKLIRKLWSSRITWSLQRSSPWATPQRSAPLPTPGRKAKFITTNGRNKEAMT